MLEIESKQRTKNYGPFYWQVKETDGHKHHHFAFIGFGVGMVFSFVKYDMRGEHHNAR